MHTPYRLLLHKWHNNQITYSINLCKLTSKPIIEERWSWLMKLFLILTFSTFKRMCVFCVFQDEMKKTGFPFVVNGKSVPHVATKVFGYLDPKTLLACRLVCKPWMEAVDSETSLWTLQSLTEAIKKGRLDVCRLIVENVKGCLLSDAETGWAPFHDAALRGETEICRLLLDHVDYAGYSAKIPVDCFGWTPLHAAARNGHTETFRLIMSNVDDKNPSWEHDGVTPLHEAAKEGHAEICRLIMDNVEDPNPADQEGRTPLHQAARWSVAHLTSAIEIVRHILDRADRKNPADKKGRTPLHEAASVGQVEIYRIIMAQVDNKNPPDQDGWTPLHEAGRLRHTDVYRLIAGNVEDQSPTDHFGRTPTNLLEPSSDSSDEDYDVITIE